MKPGSYPDLLASARIGRGYTQIFPSARFFPPRPYEFWGRPGSSRMKRALGAVDLLAPAPLRSGAVHVPCPSGMTMVCHSELSTVVNET
jgi:hypothetical protein